MGMLWRRFSAGSSLTSTLAVSRSSRARLAASTRPGRSPEYGAGPVLGAGWPDLMASSLPVHMARLLSRSMLPVPFRGSLAVQTARPTLGGQEGSGYIGTFHQTWTVVLSPGSRESTVNEQTRAIPVKGFPGVGAGGTGGAFRPYRS